MSAGNTGGPPRSKGGVTPPHSKPGDRPSHYRLPQRDTAGETVVFEKDGTRYTGRVAARGGDTVEVTDTALLLINGSVVAEPDIYEPTPRYDNGVQYPLTRADGEYFIDCAARAGGRDGRWFGPVRTGEIRGRVIALLRRSGI